MSRSSETSGHSYHMQNGVVVHGLRPGTKPARSRPPMRAAGVMVDSEDLAAQSETLRIQAQQMEAMGVELSSKAAELAQAERDADERLADLALREQILNDRLAALEKAEEDRLTAQLDLDKPNKKTK